MSLTTISLESMSWRRTAIWKNENDKHAERISNRLNAQF